MWWMIATSSVPSSCWEMARERITSSDTRPPESSKAKLETHTLQHALDMLQVVWQGLLNSWRGHAAKLLKSGKYVQPKAVRQSWARASAA